MAHTRPANDRPTLSYPRVTRMMHDVSAVHAAIIAINEAIDQQVAEETFSALQNPSAMLVNLDSEVMQQLQDQLFTAKHIKAENARNKVSPKLACGPVFHPLNSQALSQGEVLLGDRTAVQLC